MQTLIVALVAALAHEINRAYCLALGDSSQLPWADAPQWQKDSAINGVTLFLANPDTTPEQAHENWLAHKLAEGWTYGEVKDEAAKTHPCCRPYAELPSEQRAKDYLFRASVLSAKAYTEALPAPEVKTVFVEVEKGGTNSLSGVAVTYTGRKGSYTEHLYGSGLRFDKGQTRVVPAALADKLLRHPDVFAPGEASAVAEDDTAAVLATSQRQEDEQQQEQHHLQDLRDKLLQMNKNELLQFATTHYRQTLNSKARVDDLRQQVIGLVDQYGISQ